MPRLPSWNERSTESVGCAQLPGHIRIDLTETPPRATADAPQLYFHKGGQGYDPGTVPYGHVAADVLATRPPPVFTKDRIDRHGADPGRQGGPGAGRAHPRTIGAYIVEPQPIEGEDPVNWLYKPGLAGSRYTKYGDAGPVQGTGDRHFAYLCWSWVRQDGPDGPTVSGGGAIRALLAPGQIVERCAVEPMTTPAWDRDGEIVGQVVVVYVRVPVGGEALFGWVVHSHLIPDGDDWRRRAHLTPAG